MFHRDCTKLYIIWLVFLYHLLAHSSYHRTYSKLSYTYLSGIRRFSCSQTRLLYVFCSTVKQAGPTFIKSKAFGDYTPLCIIAELFCLALCKHRSLLNTTNSIGVFPLSSCFIMPNIH